MEIIYDKTAFKLSYNNSRSDMYHMLTKREKEILLILKDNDYSRAKQISNIIEVSEKTVRNDILSINNKLVDVASILSKTKFGYYLKIEKEDRFLEILHECESGIPSTPQQRIDYIIKLFLTENRYIKTEEIANMLYQSSSTISTDLRQVRKKLKQYQLSLETKPKYGMMLKGEEKHLRELESDLLYKNRDIIDDKVHNTLVNILHDVMNTYHFQISEYAFNNLVIHLVITIHRIEQGNQIKLSINYFEDIQKKLEYTIAKDIANRIHSELNVILPEIECAYISMHLLGKKIQSDKENIVIPQKYSVLIQKLLIELSREFQINFTKDLNLQLALSLHLIPLVYRLKYDLRMENPLLDSIKKNYPHAYIITTSLAYGLSKEFNKELSPDEIGYLTLHINLSMEKEFINIRKKNILLVCATGRGTAKLLEYQYRQKFDSWINRLKCCDAASLADQDFKEFDFIFTTVPIEIPVPVPVIETSFILDEDETNKIEKTIEKDPSMISYFPEGLFFNNLDLQTQEEVINFLTKQVSKFYKVPADFKDLVWKREKRFSTAFDNRVALPHPYVPCTKETFASTVLLKEPILWGNKMVRMIFLLSISKEHDPNIQTFYGKLSKLLVNDALLDKLLKHPTNDFLLQILNGIKL